MELKEFIATGIIESYLLGTATPQEVEMVHSMLSKHPSLQIEIDAVEEALLRLAESNTAAVSDSVKHKILSSIQFNRNPENNHTSDKVYTGKSIPLQATKKRSLITYGLVATIALLIVSTVINFIMFGQSKKMSGEMARLDRENVEMKSSIATYAGMVNDMQKQFTVLTDTNSKIIRLKGTKVSPTSLATVCWNKDSKKVYLYVKNLPDPPQDMQYQLWSIVDGKPVDAGVFDTGKGDTLQNMLQSTGNPQAFAVTLEKRGGSPTPTMDAMFLLGEV